MEEKKLEENKLFGELELYAEELPEITTTFGTSTMSTESSALSASCPTSSASTYTTMSSFSW
ncbi:thiocillin family RiPP [Lysinibacillus sp. NPDC056232]|uniref:thiocillin family RiPP n=1 Tax=Lysinibacillus sp. NPDC056232 TaxID=3345756 RepID=UPI0035DB415F